MESFLALDARLRRGNQAVLACCVALVLLALGSLAFALQGAREAREAASRTPVLVVPGAVGGTYSPGLAADHVLALARYLATLATNYTGARSFDERFDELESFAAATLLPRLRAARAGLRRDLDVQSQSRTFVASPAGEHFAADGPARFRYAVHGERTVYSGGLALATRSCEVRLLLSLGAPSAANRLGIALESFDLVDDTPAPSTDTPGGA